MNDVYSFLDKSLYKLTPQKEAGSSVVDPSNIDSGLSTGFSEMVSGGIKQGKNNFDNTETGFILGIEDELAKFYIGNTTNYLNWTGTELIISGEITATSGTIGGWTIGATSLSSPSSSFSIGSGNAIFKADSNGIYLGNATFASAPFSVDTAGNVKASSLERRDFHFYTMFESIDGYSKVTDATITNNPQGVDILTGATSGKEASMQKSVASSITLYSWDKDMKFKTNFRLDSVTSVDAYIWVGETALADRHLGFWVNNSTLYGGGGNGSTYDNASLQTISANTDYTIEMRYDASTRTATFYVNDVLKGTVSGTGATPTGSSSVFPVWAYVITNENVAKTLTVRYWDFWQEGI